MSCPRCQVFQGNPCDACRTLGRLDFLVLRGGLRPVDKAPVLAALRSAAGALADIAERAFAEKHTGASGPAGVTPVFSPDPKGNEPSGPEGPKEKKTKRIRVVRKPWRHSWRSS